MPSPAVNIILRSRPGWVDYRVPGRGWAYNFTSSQYWYDRSLTTLSTLLADDRNSDALWDNTAGVYSVFGTDVPAITDRGLYAGGQRTNKIDHYNLSPTDTTGLQDGAGTPIASGYVSVVDDSVALAAIVNGGNGKAYKIAIPSGAATGLYVVRGTTATLGNTNTHISSVFMRGNGASASPWIDNSVASSYYTTTSQYVRIDRTISTATVNSATMAAAHWKLEISHVTGTASEVYFILAGLEEGTFGSPPIVTAGSAATRLKDDLTIPDFATKAAAFGFGSGFTISANLDITRLSDTAARTLLSFGVDADNTARVFLDTDNRIKARLRIAGADVWTLQSGVIGSIGQYPIQVTFKPGANSLTVEGVTGASNADATALPTLTTGRVGSDFGVITPTNGPLRELQLWAS